MIFGYIACALFILPPPVMTGQQNIKITPVSNVSINGFPSFPLKNPVSFMVTDLNGTPVDRTTVQFSIVLFPVPLIHLRIHPIMRVSLM